MIIGPRALAMLKSFEGCRLHAYHDTGGVPTIGYGATGPDIRMGVVWTQAQADARLIADVARYAEYTTAMILDAVTTPAQFGALNDACYNAGPGNLAKSPMLALHRMGKYAAAGAAFIGWHVHDHEGNLEPGLVRRRAAESALYSGVV